MRCTDGLMPCSVSRVIASFWFIRCTLFLSFSLMLCSLFLITMQRYEKFQSKQNKIGIFTIFICIFYRFSIIFNSVQRSYVALLFSGRPAYCGNTHHIHEVKVALFVLNTYLCNKITYLHIYNTHIQWQSLKLRLPKAISSCASTTRPRSIVTT